MEHATPGGYGDPAEETRKRMQKERDAFFKQNPNTFNPHDPSAYTQAFMDNLDAQNAATMAAGQKVIDDMMAKMGKQYGWNDAWRAQQADKKAQQEAWSKKYDIPKNQGQTNQNNSSHNQNGFSEGGFSKKPHESSTKSSQEQPQEDPALNGLGISQKEYESLYDGRVVLSKEQVGVLVKKVFGVDNPLDTASVVSAYRKLVSKFHPDKDPQNAKVLAQQFTVVKLLKEKYDTYFK